MAEEPLELLQGTLDLLVLRALAGGEMHGYGIAQWIRKRTGGELLVQDAALYQATRRLEARGLVEAEWGMTENNRRARYYRMTEEGRRSLGQEVRAWRRYAAAVFQVLEPAGGEA